MKKTELLDLVASPDFVHFEPAMLTLGSLLQNKCEFTKSEILALCDTKEKLGAFGPVLHSFPFTDSRDAKDYPQPHTTLSIFPRDPDWKLADEALKELAEFSPPDPLFPDPRPVLLVDGANLLGHRDDWASLQKTLESAKAKIKNLDYQVWIVLHQKHRKEVMKNLNLISLATFIWTPKHLCDDLFLLKTLIRLKLEGYAVHLLTNDQYRDHLDKYSFPALFEDWFWHHTTRFHKELVIGVPFLSRGARSSRMYFRDNTLFLIHPSSFSRYEISFP